MLDLAVDLWPYDLLAARIRELRATVSSYDAAYVALAELLATPLVTLDRRMQRAPGITCSVSGPPG